MVQGDSGSVRPGWILVLVFQLRICCINTDITVLRHLPLDDSAAALAGIDEITLNLKVAWVEVTLLILFEVRHVIGVKRFVFIAFLIEPTVLALLAKIVLHICEVLSGLTLIDGNVILVGCAASIHEGHIQITAVVGRILIGVHDKIELICGGYIDFLLTEGDDILTLLRRSHFLGVQALVVLIDTYHNSVRPLRIAIVLLELGVFHTKFYGTVLRRLPCHNGRII